MAKITFEEVTDYLTINDQVMVIDKRYVGYAEILLQSPDEAAELFAHIMKVSKIYILFCDFIRQGYAILIESIMVELLLRYKFGGKRSYVKLYMRTTDTNYEKMTHSELEELLWNQCSVITAGRSMIAMDNFCEMLNDWIKKW